MPAGRSWRRNGPYWLFQLASGIAAAAHELSGVSVYLPGGSCLKPSEDQLPDRFTISNLKLHYLLRQDFLAANLASFFASFVDKTKDGGMLDAPQSTPCALWQQPGSAELGGEVSRCRQAPADPPQAWKLELQALLHVAFLVALFKSSLWATLKPPSAHCPVMGLVLLYPSLASAARQSFLAFKSNMIISYSQISRLCIGPLLSVFRPSGSSSCRSFLSP